MGEQDCALEELFQLRAQILLQVSIPLLQRHTFYKEFGACQMVKCSIDGSIQHFVWLDIW